MKLTRLQFHIEALKDFALIAAMALCIAGLGALASLVLQAYVRGAY